MAAEIHVGDVGTVFEATVLDEDGAVVDISAATLRQLLFRKADQTVVTQTAVLSGAGTDGKMRYVTVVDDLDVSGLWTVQGYVEMSAGKWHSDLRTFQVYRNLA